MKKSIIILSVLLLFIGSAHWAASFCGFYVAAAEGKLFNKKSEVILVRDGNMSYITMSNDYEGPLDQFAMVVPVPTVLKKTDIQIVDREIFQKLDAYSAPRLTEYFDDNPCQTKYYEEEASAADLGLKMTETKTNTNTRNKDYGVKIEAVYEVGEYDILILSAKESSGLTAWLVKEGYKIPEKAHEVLAPYIKENLKFFVVKVNLQKMEGKGDGYLRPLRIQFESPKFMLPIRLGMANSTGEQDMLVYAFTRNGRIETVNYRTIEMPTNLAIPEFIQKDFGNFYLSTFEQAYINAEKKGVFLEYAWDLNSDNYMFCDPCNGTPPTYEILAKAGVNWVSPYEGYSVNYQGNVFFTRLHVRYSRENFPQDLVFQETPNRENFQCRYYIRHLATGDLDCEEGKEYIKGIRPQLQKEMDNLLTLTNWEAEKYSFYFHKADYLEKEYNVGSYKEEKKNIFLPGISDGGTPPQDPLAPYMNTMIFILIGVLVIVGGIWLLKSNMKA